MQDGPLQVMNGVNAAKITISCQRCCSTFRVGYERKVQDVVCPYCRARDEAERSRLAKIRFELQDRLNEERARRMIMRVPESRMAAG